MYNIALVDADNICKNATSSPNAGVYPACDEAAGEYLAEITQAEFDAGPLGKYYNSVTGQLEPFENRRLALLTAGPYSVGVVTLQYQQQDLDGQEVVEAATFTVTVNGQSQEVLVEDGTLEVEITCLEPATVSIGITAYRYEAVSAEVIVDG